MSLLSTLLNFVLDVTSKYNIDESHGIIHSMDVLHNSHNIFNFEVKNNSYLKEHEKIIYICTIIHDLCDKKYIDEQTGINEIKNFLGEKITPEEMDIICKIILTMSYSKVKINGYPDLGIYQLAYHIVREADLLSGYDFDRCLIYKMRTGNLPFNDVIKDAELLFETRIFKYIPDDLFITEYSKKEALILHNKATDRMNSWRQITKNI